MFTEDRFTNFAIVVVILAGTVTCLFICGLFALDTSRTIASLPTTAPTEVPAPTLPPARSDFTPEIATPTATPAATLLPEQISAETLVTNMPAATSIPAFMLSFTDIVQNPEEKGWTSVQYSTYFETIQGQRVNGWSGMILEIQETLGGKSYLSLDMKPGDPRVDAYLYIDKNDVLRVSLGQNVIFDGTIQGNWSEDNGLYALEIKDVTLIELGEIPTPAPPTPTPGPTYTPTPDIGDNITAEVMCKDFVRKNLKSPSTASFGGFFDDWDTAIFIEAERAKDFGVDTAKLHNSGLWIVNGEVDAQNSFGAMIRSNYTCVMDYNSSTKMWYLLDISIK